MKILFFKLGALGDVLMTTPLVREVHKMYPDAQIDYYVGESYCEALWRNDDINNIITFKQDMFFKKDFFGVKKLFKQIKKSDYDVMFVLDKHWIVSLFGWYSGIPTRIGFDRDFKGWFNTGNIHYEHLKHEIHYYLEMIFHLCFTMIPLDTFDKSIKFNIDKDDLDITKRVFKRMKFKKSNTICVIPGGANNPGVGDDSIRRWHELKYATLINELLDRNYNIIILGGKCDSNVNERVLQNVKIALDKILDFTGITTLSRSAAVMSMCKYVICNDSGPMHLASAVNDKVISIFGPTHPKRKAPLNKKSTAIWKDQYAYDDKYELYGDKSNLRKVYMQKITVNNVLGEIKK